MTARQQAAKTNAWLEYDKEIQEDAVKRVERASAFLGFGKGWDAALREVMKEIEWCEHFNTNDMKVLRQRLWGQE